MTSCILLQSITMFSNPKWKWTYLHTQKQVVADVCTHSAAVCQFQCQHLRKTTARRGKINPNLYMVDLWWFERFISLSWICQAESNAQRLATTFRSCWCLMQSTRWSSTDRQRDRKRGPVRWQLGAVDKPAGEGFAVPRMSGRCFSLLQSTLLQVTGF